MTKVYFPFDAGTGANSAEDRWRQMAQYWLGTGVIQGQLNQHFPFADASGMQVKVMSGRSWIQGHFFEDDAQETIAIAASDPTNPRIDRLVIRADFTANTVDYVILQGTPAASPAVPALTTSTTRWEIPIAQVRVDAAVATIAASKITDERVLVGNQNSIDELRSNLLTNPGFEIWQRGAGAFSADAAYTADRWQIGVGGTTVFSITRDTANADTGATGLLGSQYCAAVVISSWNAASYFKQKIEDYYQLRGRTVTFSARVKCATASRVRLALDTSGAGALVYSSYHSGSGLYETLSITTTMTATATGQTAYVVFDGNCTAYIDNATLAEGSLPLAYKPLHPAEDLARCLRYYEVQGGVANALATTAPSSGAASNISRGYGFAARKAVVPTVTKNGTWTVLNTTGQPATQAPNVDGYGLTATTINVAGQVGFFCADATCTVTAEANP